MAALALSAAPALALETHVFERALGSVGTGAGQLDEPAGVAVSEATHDVYVADAGNHRVEEFSSSGAFILTFGFDVNKTKAGGVATQEEKDVCTATEVGLGAECQAGASGSAPGQFTTPSFVALDPSNGDVYVGDTGVYGGNTVTKFTAEGALVESWGVKGQLTGYCGNPGEAAPCTGSAPVAFEEISGLTVDSAGKLDLLEQLGNSAQFIVQFEQAGAFASRTEVKTSLVPEKQRGLGVNAAGEFFEVELNGAVGKFTAAGADVGQVSLTNNEATTGLAVDGATGELYADRNGRLVEHFAFNGSGEVVEAGGSPCPVQPSPEPTGLGHGCPASDSFGSKTLEGGGGRGVAVDGGNADVYVADGTAGRIDMFAPATLPDVTTLPAGEVQFHTATLHGIVKPDGVQLTECEFQYVEAALYEAAAEDPYAAGRTVPCTAAPGSIATSGETQVEADVSGLSQDTDYHFRLLAGNAKGQNTGGDETLHTAGARVESESVVKVTNDSAELQATIEPNGAAATYYFQYVDEAHYNPSAADPYEAGKTTAIGTIAAGAGGVEVSQSVQGLSADTAYRYRVVAVEQQSFGTEQATGEDRVFTTRPTGEFSLPDNRQWQMVSPPQKQGALIEPIGQDHVIKAAANGNAVTYAADAPTEANPAGYDNFVQVFSARGAAGWQSRDLTFAHTEFAGQQVGFGQEYRFFSEDLSAAIMQPFGSFIGCEGGQTCLSSEASEQTAFSQDPVSGVFTPLVTGCPASGGCRREVEEHANVPAGTVFGDQQEQSAEKCGNEAQNPASSPCGPLFLGASADGRHVVLEGIGLTGTPTPAGGLYEWSADAPPSEQLRLVNLLPPSGEEAAPPAGESWLGGGQGSFIVRSAVSDDGSRVVFSSENHLYLRVNATAPQSPVSGGACTVAQDACTVQVDAGVETGEPAFEAASADGSRVFFIEGDSLYEYELGHGPAIEIATGLPLGKGSAMKNPIPGTSQDGSWVYFVSEDVLAGAKPSSRGEAPRSGQPNLYALHGGVLRLVAVLAQGDKPDWAGNSTDHAELNFLTVRVSPDGRWLAFMSQRSLTGYDNRDAVSGQADEQVFLYHAPEDLGSGAGSLVCASCNPSGARPHGMEYYEHGIEGQEAMPLAGGDRVWPQGSWLAANIPGWTPYQLGVADYQSRYLSDSGRLFFNAVDGLVSKDLNGAVDVYEYEPQGLGGCSGQGAAGGATVFEPQREPASGVVEPAGCVSLISSGASSNESAFLDASENGSDVFFLTSEKLVRQDGDNALDVYDAHECTSGSPCLPEAAGTPPPCGNEASCRAAPASQPAIYGSPASATFSGPGNPTPSVSSKTVKALTRAQKLARALKACHRIRKRAKRRRCERTARKRYGAKAGARGRRASNNRRAGR